MAPDDGAAPVRSLPIGDSALRALTRTVQLVLAGLVAYAIIAGQWGQFVNATLMLAIALVPDALRYRYDLPHQPLVAFLVATAPLLHAVGAMGPYRAIPAFDQVAHAVSATLVAGLGYAVLGVVEAETDAVVVPSSLRAVFVLVFATSFGVAWEILEFSTGLLSTVTGGEQLLAQYGPSDVVLDLLFNTGAALVVAVWGTAYFEKLRRLARRRASADE